MKSKAKMLVIAGIGITLCAVIPARSQETVSRAKQPWVLEPGVRQLRVVEDRDQRYMATKVYELKNIYAGDIVPWVQGAVQRYHPLSTVERCEYKEGGYKQYIVVNTGVDMLPYIDDMVAKLDRPSKIVPAKVKDGSPESSNLEGTGIYKFVYYPKFRANPNMINIGPVTGSEDGSYFYDRTNSLFYWKDSKSDGETSYKWFQALDRPLPQVELKLNVYEINSNDMKELGIDYISWKNGPGANIFATGLDMFNFKSFGDVSNFTNSLDVVSKVSHTFGGFMVAPQIDATFIRLLAQKGKARIATSGSLTVVNDYNFDPGDNNFSHAKYKLLFTPDYQDIQKDKEQNTSVNSTPSNIYFYLRKPTVNFTGGDNGDKAATIEFGYVLNVVDTVEKTNKGTDAQNNQFFRSWLSASCGSEKLVACYEKDHLVMQNDGIPYLCDVPGLKYLVGSSVESKSKTKVFITVSVSSVSHEADLSEWAGKVVTAAELIKKDEENKEAPSVNVNDGKRIE